MNGAGASGGGVGGDLLRKTVGAVTSGAGNTVGQAVGGVGKTVGEMTRGWDGGMCWGLLGGYGWFGTEGGRVGKGLVNLVLLLLLRLS